MWPLVFNFDRRIRFRNASPVNAHGPLRGAVKVIYVSYDGALDPLGASQVIPYLFGLADRGFAITLVSFEKPERWRQQDVRNTQARLEARSIRWRPLRYHKHPRLAATSWDVLAGNLLVASEARRWPPALIHCRGDIAMLMTRWAHRLPKSTRLLYDVRGFFSDERVEIGSWRRGGVLDRTIRRIEVDNLQRADGVVVLTHHAAEVLRRRSLQQALRVIPTCADTAVFKPRSPGQKPEFGLVYSGSLGTWYMASEMVAFARLMAGIVPAPTLFLTPEPQEVTRLGVSPDWAEVRAVEPGAVAGWLRRASVLFFFIRPIHSKRASCPTKFAEGLASGLPVVCNRGIGDLDDVIEQEGVGVLVDGFSEPAYSAAARRLKLLLEDPGLPERCRRLAETRYSLKVGVEAYQQLYVELIAGAIPTDRGRH